MATTKAALAPASQLHRREALRTVTLNVLRHRAVDWIPVHDIAAAMGLPNVGGVLDAFDFKKAFMSPDVAAVIEIAGLPKALALSLTGIKHVVAHNKSRRATAFLDWSQQNLLGV